MSERLPSRDEVMAVATATFIANGQTVFIGTGLPMVAAYLAKATHAPDATLLFESGVLDAEPKELATGVGDFRLVTAAHRVSGMADALLLLHGGNVGLGVLGCAQIDGRGNVNSTVVGGSYAQPKVRLPGSGGANDIASLAERFVVVTRHSTRTFVDAVDYITSPGYLTGPGARERARLPGGGPIAVVSDLAVMDFDVASCRMRLASLHPGVQVDQVVEATGFELVIPADPPTTVSPTDDQLALLSRIDSDGVFITRD